MKAIVCKEWAKPEALSYEDLPDLEAGDGEVVIAVKACGVNFADALMVQGLYQVKPPLPFTPGFEVAGDILAVGEGVALKVGQRVATVLDYGAFAEQVCVPALGVMPIPNSMSYQEAAAFAIAYGTAEVALAHRGQLQAGETVLVHGASGGVGLATVEIAKAMGATVIATASTAEKLELAQSHGADHLINYQEEDFVAKVKDITAGKGADVILDPVGGDVFDKSLRCIAWEGRLLVIGFASGRIPEAPANLTLVKNCSVVGVFWGAYMKHNPKVITASLQRLMQWHDEGKIKPHISEVFKLEDTAVALNKMLGRAVTGKVVLEP